MDPKAIWQRDNEEEVTYMGGHDVPVVTVADVYECYDFLKGRSGKKYGAATVADPEPAPAEVEEDVYVEPEVSGGMNPSRQEVEDFFMDASTRVRGRSIGASKKEITAMLNPYNYGGKLVITFYDSENMFNLNDMDDEDINYMVDSIAEGLEPYGIYVSDGVVTSTTKLVNGIRAYQAILDYSEVDDHRESQSPSSIRRVLQSVFDEFDLVVADCSFQ
jgi:hypothetical protein